jgi:DNA invertase Pin-like site-specific DNA recombinase
VATVLAAVAVRAGIYARISSDRHGDQLGVRRQLADCESLAERRGWVVVERYVDDDVSAYRGKPRPEYERLCGDIEAGAIDAVAIYHSDRLHRHPRELEAFIDLCHAARLTNVASVSGDLDLTTHEGQLMARIQGAVAKKESDDKSRRILRKHAELAERGKVSGGGSRPYGYEADKRTLRPAEAEIVRECARRFLAGESLRSITADLNRRGVPAAGGGAWSQQSLRRMLGGARISGQREHHGEIVATKAEWPAIITASQSRQIRATLADPARRTSKEPRRYLLAGLLVCSHCGEKLVARPRAGGQRRYSCVSGGGFAGCGKTAIKADDVEQFIAEAVLYRLDSPEVAAAVEGRPKEPDAQRWYDQLEADQAQLEQLATAHGERQISFAEWMAAKKPVEQRMTLARKQLAHATRASALDQYVGRGDELREQWDSLDLSQQHAIVEAVVAHIVVGPGRRGYNRFDESRLRPVWRP